MASTHAEPQLLWVGGKQLMQQEGRKEPSVPVDAAGGQTLWPSPSWCGCMSPAVTQLSCMGMETGGRGSGIQTLHPIVLLGERFRASVSQCTESSVLCSRAHCCS